MIRHWLRRGLAATLVALAAFTFGTSAVKAADPIKIGAVLAVTGGASFLGDPELKTLQMYIGSINKSGGVLGRQLELIHYDTGGDPKKSATAVKRLIENDQVDVIIGDSTTGATMAIIPLVERAEIPLISLAGAVVIIDPVKKWVFKTPHTDAMACRKIFEDMNKRGISKIGMISGTGGFQKSMQAQCKALAPSYGIEVLADESYNPKDSDMTVQLTKIKNTAGVQAVLNCGFGQAPAIVTRNFKQLGMTMPMYQSHGVASKSYIDLAGDAAEGVRLPAAAVVVAEKLADNDPQRVVVVSYKEAYEERWGSDVSTFGGHAYDALQLAISAMARAGTTDKAAVRDEIEATRGYIGTGGIVNMSVSDHMGLDLSAFQMLEIRGGDWTLVD